ncbi:MAG: GTPase ObgE [Patescibacteria group bacterium]
MVKITIKAGDGGDGAVSFHREKFVTRGGPDGGDGGKGGSVYFVANNNTSTLDDFRSKKVFGAQNGEAGKKLKMYGKNGEDAFIKVPVGTLIFEVDPSWQIPQHSRRGTPRISPPTPRVAVEPASHLVADLNQLGAEFLIAKGGRGGKGNYKFKSSTNQTPTQYIPGEDGEQKEVVLELKLIADVGLIGLPSAGKSTLINALTHINAKVAEYHFTTLTPNLGVWEIDRGKKVVVADIPGLIEGASSGKGLGDEFLRHIERTKVLVHLVDPTVITSESVMVTIDSAKVYQSYQVILKELQQYKVGLWDITKKPQVVVINKVDITEVKESLGEIIDYFNNRGVDVLPISAATGEGLDDLRKKVLELLSHSVEPQIEIEPVVKKYNIYNLPGLNRRPVLTKEVKGLT